MIETVRDLKIGDCVVTHICPMSQKYMQELENEKELFGEDSDEYKLAKKEYDEIWGERKGILIKIGECFSECVIKTSDEKEIGLFYPMIGDMGHWNKSESCGGKFFLNISLEE